MTEAWARIVVKAKVVACSIYAVCDCWGFICFLLQFPFVPMKFFSVSVCMYFSKLAEATVYICSTKTRLTYLLTC